MPSLQLLAVQTPATQAAEEQSAGTLQCLPSAHFCVHTPPQSTSVSEPFFLPSLQLGPTQTPPEHEPDVQSVPARQPEPIGQRSVQSVPPQSMSVSVPSRLPSVQLAAWAQWPPMQFPVEQSAAVMQPCAGAHLFAQLPPQSTSVSSASSMPSEQWAAPQMPSAQVWPPLQTTPKHEASAQALFTQTWPFGHCMPPQLVGTQAPERQPWSAPQVTSTQARSVQWDLEQICDGAHVVPLQVLS
jgi:hypothetical protein